MLRVSFSTEPDSIPINEYINDLKCLRHARQKVHAAL